MIDTRQRLQQLLDRDKISGNFLAEISKVPAPTIYRFLSGDIGEPRASTICKWAQAFKVSEAQMRGIDPIAGLDDIPEVAALMTLESVLTPDELIAIEGMRRVDKETRRSWLRLTNLICKNTARAPRTTVGENRVTPDRRGMRSIAPGSKGPKYCNPIQTDQAAIGGEPKKA